MAMKAKTTDIVKYTGAFHDPELQQAIGVLFVSGLFFLLLLGDREREVWPVCDFGGKATVSLYVEDFLGLE